MRLLFSMSRPLLLCKCTWALEAEVVGCERGDGLAIGGFGRLGHDGVVVEDAPQYHLVVLYRRVDDILVLAEHPLHMLCIEAWCQSGYFQRRDASPEQRRTATVHGHPCLRGLYLDILGRGGSSRSRRHF